MYPDLHRHLDSALISKNITKTLFPEKSPEAGTSETPSDVAVGAADRSKELGSAMVRFLASMEASREGALDETWTALVKRVNSNRNFSAIFFETFNALDGDLSLAVVDV